MTELKEKKCIPCEGGVPALPEEEKLRLKKEVSSSWAFTHEKTRLFRQVKMKNWAEAFALAEKISDLAESEWHHPEMTVGFGHLDLAIWTHKIGDLVESDFIFAAKADAIIDS